MASNLQKQKQMRLAAYSIAMQADENRTSNNALQGLLPAMPAFCEVNNYFNQTPVPDPSQSRDVKSNTVLSQGRPSPR